MKNINKTLTSFTGRTLIYLTIFIVGLALHESLFRLIKPIIWSNSSILLTLSTLSAFMLVGAVFVCEKHIMSRVTSAATLLILAFIALRIGHSAVPDPYLLVVALGIAAIGAQPVLHRKLTSFKLTVLYSVLTVFVTFVLAAVFAYTMTVLDRISTQ